MDWDYWFENTGMLFAAIPGGYPSYLLLRKWRREIRQGMEDAVSGNPDDIKRIAEGWELAGDTIVEHTGKARDATARAMAHWEGEAADGFRTYMRDLIDVLDRHHESTEEIKDHLDDVVDAIEKARREISELLSENYERVRDIIIGAGLGALAGSPGGPPGALVGAIVGECAAIIAVVNQRIADIQDVKDDKIEGIMKALAGIAELLKEDKVEELGSPPEPTIVTAPSLSSDEFESENQPPELDGATVGTRPPAKGGVVGQGSR